MVAEHGMMSGLIWTDGLGAVSCGARAGAKNV